MMTAAEYVLDYRDHWCNNWHMCIYPRSSKQANCIVIISLETYQSELFNIFNKSMEKLIEKFCF